MKTIRELKITAILLVLTLILAFFRVGFSQETEIKIDADEQELVIDSIAKFMADKYVFPDVGEQMGDLVKKNLKDGVYNNINNPQEFAAKVTEDLRSVSNDKHIGLRYAPEMIAMIKKTEKDENNKEYEEYEKKMRESNNFAFKEIKILPGNVGYLKFNAFYGASVAGPTAIAALNFLAYTDALIIDLTDNGGGSPSLIQLMTSYFFEDTEHLNSFYIREGDKTQQFWTLPYVPGKKMTETDLYVLTSTRTFSGAEEFTYNLKNMERATIIGETTGGGAHPVERHIINDNFGITIPFGRAVNPITNTNWEGTGIEPNIETTKAEAKETAYLMALEKLSEKEQDEKIKYGIDWAIAGLKAKLNPIDLDKKIMESYVGTYGPRKITFENGVLYYQREDRPKMKM
ncbi:MAG: S41 family peptidase, partial [Bacteroidales bacterium]|nr:S41 family peptidase [Bacteroidales bacterium]